VRPRLSIVVPFYGVQAYIGDCLDSLARQTFSDVEVVLVDDGSTDASATIAQEFVERDRRFRVVSQENQGLGPARNTGVKHSVGEFVTFVDSDDVVPRHAYELMIRSLDHTGSSFAAGDARRFNSSGVRESWVHRIPFARARRATHITEFPELTLDRMVWNKVYRRSFWDEFGFEFPAMRYEDYPVTLQAHLDAVTVDVLPAPVYYWRERESGESITQQAYEYSNLVDRVTSAEMVTSLVAARAPQLRPHVHRHFAQIDLVALLQAFHTVPVADEESLVALGRRFIGTLDTQVLDLAPRFNRLQFHALRGGDVDLLRQLAAFRHDGGLRGGTRARRRRLVSWQYESEYPGWTDRPRRAPRRMYRLGSDEFRLHTMVTDLRWHGAALTVRGTAEIRHLRTDGRSSLRVTLTGDDVEIPCEVTRFTGLDSHGDRGLVGFEVRIDCPVLVSLPAATEAVHLSVEMVNGRFRRRGVLRGLHSGSPVFSPGRWVGEGIWVQPCQGPGGRLVFKRFEHPARVSSVLVHDDAFDVSGRLGSTEGDAHLLLSRPSSGTIRVVSLDLVGDGAETRFGCRVSPANVLDADDLEDGLDVHTSWDVRIEAGDRRHALLATGLDRAVGIVYDSRLVMLTRTPSNQLTLRVSPPGHVADVVDAGPPDANRRLLVGGPIPDCTTGWAFVWRRFLDETDEPIDAVCRTTETGDRWSAIIDLDDLTTDRTACRRELASVIWTLFSVAGDGSAHAVRVDEFLASRLPVQLADRGNNLTVIPPSGLLRVVVR
jgi:hypothetical protein